MKGRKKEREGGREEGRKKERKGGREGRKGARNYYYYVSVYFCEGGTADILVLQFIGHS